MIVDFHHSSRGAGWSSHSRAGKGHSSKTRWKSPCCDHSLTLWLSILPREHVPVQVAVQGWPLQTVPHLSWLEIWHTMVLDMNQCHHWEFRLGTHNFAYLPVCRLRGIQHRGSVYKKPKIPRPEPLDNIIDIEPNAQKSSSHLFCCTVNCPFHLSHDSSETLILSIMLMKREASLILLFLKCSNCWTKSTKNRN